MVNFYEGRITSLDMTGVSLQKQAFPIVGSTPVDQANAYTPGGISGFQRIGFGILVLYLFLIYSRVFDVKFAYLHIPGISYRVIFAMVVLSQAFVRALKSDVGKALLAFTAWFVIAIPASMWRRGSLDLLLNGWLPAFVIFLATAGLIGNFDQCKKAIVTVAWGLLVLTGIAMVWGTTQTTGRLFLPNGKFANPNELAQALLLGLSLWFLIYSVSKSAISKAFAGVVMLVMLLTISRTGSRGALIAFGVLVLSAFLRSTPGGKMKIIIGGVVLAVVVGGTMSKRLINRYRTLSADKGELTLNAEDQRFESSAYESTDARKALLLKSIKYTFEHPLFGVGPGMFPVAEEEEAHKAGLLHGQWQGTHNSYTQVSSECGIPACIFYCTAIFLALRKTSRIYRQTRNDPRLEDIANIAVGLNYALIVYAVTVTFDYIAYTSMLPVFAGLSCALGSTLEAEIAMRTGQAPSHQPAPQAAPVRVQRVPRAVPSHPQPASTPIF